MELENRVRVKMRQAGWEAFKDSFAPRPDENPVGLERSGVYLSPAETEHLDANIKRLRALMTVVGSSKMSVPFEAVGSDIVCEHKLWLLMEYLESRPDYIDLVESRL